MLYTKRMVAAQKVAVKELVLALDMVSSYSISGLYLTLLSYVHCFGTHRQLPVYLVKADVPLSYFLAC